MRNPPSPTVVVTEPRQKRKGEKEEGGLLKFLACRAVR